MAAKKPELKVIVLAELLVNAFWQAGAITMAKDSFWQAAIYLSLLGFIMHVILIGYRLISLMHGFLNEVAPMITLSDSILKELALKQPGK